MFKDLPLPFICLFHKEHEVEKMFTLKGGHIPSAAVKNIVFFVRPRLELMDIIAENIARFNYIHSHLVTLIFKTNGEICWNCPRFILFGLSKAILHFLIMSLWHTNALLVCFFSPHCSEDKLQPPRDFHILFVPRRSLLCEQRLKEKGVLNSFTNIDEYILDLIPYDSDLLSMESENSFRVRGSLNAFKIARVHMKK